MIGVVKAESYLTEFRALIGAMTRKGTIQQQTAVLELTPFLMKVLPITAQLS